MTLTIDSSWQAAAELALAQGIESARQQKNENIKDKRFETLKAPGGAVVAMDVTDGSVVAMASFPNYDASQFVDGISQTEWTSLNDNPDHPLVNRATQGEYAPGSTFKLVTSVAMTNYGIRGPDEWITDEGSVMLGKDEREFSNAGKAALGRLKLQGALTRSSDTYFYTAGQRVLAGVEQRRHGSRPRAADDGARVRIRRDHRCRARRRHAAAFPIPSGRRSSRTRRGRPRSRSARTASGIPPTTS